MPKTVKSFYLKSLPKKNRPKGCNQIFIVVTFTLKPFYETIPHHFTHSNLPA